MASNEFVTTVINVQILHKDGFYAARSYDLPGLHLCCRDKQSLLDHLPEIIEMLLEENRNVDVQAVFPVVPAGSFPEAVADGPDQYVVQAPRLAHAV